LNIDNEDLRALTERVTPEELAHVAEEMHREWMAGERQLIAKFMAEDRWADVISEARAVAQVVRRRAKRAGG
jgi:hypothetical protein